MDLPLPEKRLGRGKLYEREKQRMMNDSTYKRYFQDGESEDDKDYEADSAQLAEQDEFDSDFSILSDELISSKKKQRKKNKSKRRKCNNDAENNSEDEENQQKSKKPRKLLKTSSENKINDIDLNKVKEDDDKIDEDDEIKIEIVQELKLAKQKEQNYSIQTEKQRNFCPSFLQVQNKNVSEEQDVQQIDKIEQNNNKERQEQDEACKNKKMSNHIISEFQIQGKTYFKRGNQNIQIYDIEDDDEEKVNGSDQKIKKIKNGQLQRTDDHQLNFKLTDKISKKEVVNQRIKEIKCNRHQKEMNEVSKKNSFDYQNVKFIIIDDN